MKVLLVYAPIWKVMGFKSSYNTGLGIAFIGAALRANGHEVRIIDAEAYQFWHEDVLKIIDEWKPTHVGISSLITALKSAIDLSVLIKNNYPEIWVAIGGAGASAAPEYTLKISKCDSVTVGEGELLVDDSFTKRGIINGLSPEDLDTLPTPAYDLIEPKIGSEYWSGQIPRPPGDFSVKETVVMWSRGCPHKCIFCCKSSIRRGATRMRSPECIVFELDYLHKNFGINSVYVYDDELMGMSVVHNKWIMSVLEAIEKWNFEGERTTPKIYLKGQGRCSKTLVTDELVKAFKRAGFFQLSMGCESGSDKIKEVIKKHLTNEDIRHTLPLIKKHGIEIYTFWMIGIPEETSKEAKETERLVAEMAPYTDYIQILVFTPFPSSDFWDTAIDNGWLFPALTKDERYEKAIERLFGTFEGTPILEMPWMTQEQIIAWQKKLYSVHYATREAWLKLHPNSL